MNIEEKARAYDKALKWMRELYPGLHGATKEDAEHYFPELRESEDERIRKYLVEELKAAKSVGELKFTIPQPTREECIAYLEKQKEQKSIGTDFRTAVKNLMNLHKIKNKFTEEDYDFHTKELLELVEQKPVEIDEYEIIKKHITEDLLSSDVNKRLKECGWYVTEEKPTEWSEEDERMTDNIVSVLGQYIDYKAVSGTGSGYATPRYTKEIDWLKSISPQPKPEWSEEDKKVYSRLLNHYESLTHCVTTADRHQEIREELNFLKSLRPQPKQEWSDEDVDMLNSCISSIEEAKENRYSYKETDGDTSYDHEIDWLKSLRPSWKPNEEQMEALKCAVEDIARFSRRGGRQVELENAPFYSALHSLYCNLEKLM